MQPILRIFRVIFTACRAYSIPISVMSWIVPFIYAALNGGNIKYGILAGIGIVFLHLGTNLFDDVIDYIREKREVEKKRKKEFNFQKGKCICIINGQITLKQCSLLISLLFLISILIAVFFINVWGLKLLYIIVPAAILCLLYPILGCLGFGELIVAIIFSPLLYTGVNFAMTGSFSYKILLLSVSTGMLAVAVLHNHMLLDYKLDTANRKITLCRICGSEKNSLILLFLIVTAAYLNLIILVFYKKLGIYFLIPLLSLPWATTLIKVMVAHINNPNVEIKQNIITGNLNSLKKVPPEQRNFMLKFLSAQNLLSFFTILLCLAIVLDKVL